MVRIKCDRGIGGDFSEPGVGLSIFARKSSDVKIVENAASIFVWWNLTSGFNKRHGINLDIQQRNVDQLGPAAHQGKGGGRNLSPKSRRTVGKGRRFGDDFPGNNFRGKYLPERVILSKKTEETIGEKKGVDTGGPGTKGGRRKREMCGMEKKPLTPEGRLTKQN